MRLREICATAWLVLALIVVGGVSPAAGQAVAESVGLTQSKSAEAKLTKERFAAIDPVIAALIPVGRKNQAPAVVRLALSNLRKHCVALDRRDRLQLALRRDCMAVVGLSRVTLLIGGCRGYKGCGLILARTGREFARSLIVAKQSNRVYRNQLRGRCLSSFLTPRSELHLLNRLRFRVSRLASAFERRDPLDLFVEQLLWDQLLFEIDDDGPTARESWRAFRSACRPKKTVTAAQTS